MWIVRFSIHSVTDFASCQSLRSMLSEVGFFALSLCRVQKFFVVNSLALVDSFPLLTDEVVEILAGHLVKLDVSISVWELFEGAMSSCF